MQSKTKSVIDDLEEFGILMSGLAANFSADPPAKPLLDMWWEAFKADGFGIEQIRIAANKLLRTRKYTNLPTYADFFQAINGDKKKIENKAVLEAWENLTRRLRSAGAKECRRRGFGDKKIEFAVMMLGGWDVLQNWKESELPFRQRDFREAYLVAMADDTELIGIKIDEVNPAVQDLVSSMVMKLTK